MVPVNRILLLVKPSLPCINWDADRRRPTYPPRGLGAVAAAAGGMLTLTIVLWGVF